LENQPFRQKLKGYMSNGLVDYAISQMFFPDERGQQRFWAEAGCTVGGSNTYYFAMKRNWNGLCFNPDESIQYHNRKTYPAQRTHFYNAGLWNESKTLSFYRVQGLGGRSRLKDTFDTAESAAAFANSIQKFRNDSHTVLPPVSVRVTSLKSVLEERSVKKLDYLSLDCEGCELPALQGLDLINTDVSVITVERRNPFHFVDNFLRSADYIFIGICSVGWDAVFVSRKFVEELRGCSK
jgi:FkbM family methyltransferase